MLLCFLGDGAGFEGLYEVLHNVNRKENGALCSLH